MKNTAFVCTVLVAISIQLVSAIELVELNDANKNELNLHLSKALAGVQEAYQNGYKFESVKDIRKFLGQCEYVNTVMSGSSDSAYKGLAQRIKTVMAEPDIAGPCSVSAELTPDFDELDTGFSASDYDYLSARVLEKLNKFNEKTGANKNLATVVQYVIANKAADLVAALLKSASADCALFLGEEEDSSDKKGMFDLDTRDKRLCDASLIEPICKLVRRSPQKVAVIARDFSDFAQLVRAKDEAKMQQYATASGVTIGELKANCKKMLSKRKQAFKPIELIRGYVASGLVDEQQVEETVETDTELSSYSALYDLCLAVE